MQWHKNYGAWTYVLFTLLTFALKMAVFNCDLTLQENTQAKLTMNLLYTVRSNWDRIISPTLVQDSLIVAALGAENGSLAQKELQQAAEVSGSKDSLATELRRLSAAANLKSKLYVNTRLKLKSKFKQRTKHIPAEFVKFNESEKISTLINDFVARQTKNLLEKKKSIIKKKRVDADSSMIAIDSINFSAEWSIPVIANRSTRNSMYINGNFLYGRVKDLKATAAVLPFKRSKAHMLLVFNDKSNDLIPLENRLRKVDVTTIPSVLNYTQTGLYVPNFRFQTVYSLYTEILEKLKIEEALTGNSKLNDFFEQNVESYLKSFVHHSSISVSKTGVNFASATSVQYEITDNIPLGIKLFARATKLASEIEDKGKNPFFFYIINGKNILAAGSSYNKF